MISGGIFMQVSRPSKTPIVRRRGDVNSQDKVNTSPALSAPCWPSCGRCSTLLKSKED